MAASFAKSVSAALNREKPHSSITDWVEILTTRNYDEEAYDGIPEIVDSINLQASGVTEASRAIRKKLKHGDTHQQYRALAILKALVENCGHKFQTTFANGQLTDALKHLASDPATDQKVKKKLLMVLASWNKQFKGDPSMGLVANLYQQCKPSDQRRSVQQNYLSEYSEGWDKKNREKEEAKREKEELKERKRKEEEEARKAKEKVKYKGKKRPTFDFEKDKPLVLNSIAYASQASTHLVNAITLVNNNGSDSLKNDAHVQECLANAKEARKSIVRYIQLVENEELIGTLIETNERIIAAMQTYDKMTSSAPVSTPDIASDPAAIHIFSPESEVNKLQERQRVAVERVVRERDVGRSKARDDGHVYPDLQDLNFGSLGSDQRNLPPPLSPTGPSSTSLKNFQDRGSLSDFSDYESSDEDTRTQQRYQSQASSSSAPKPRRGYVDVSDDPDSDLDAHRKGANQDLLVDTEDPFADPFSG